ncbi:MAG: BREX-2 system phosphatase PglZ [Pseudonocardia sp.]|nr:BREX-2 system phosphatase PglZ [Pseudonocardia sp.]
MATAETLSAAERAVLERVRTLLSRNGDRQPTAIGIRVAEPPIWQGEPDQQVDGVPIRVMPCPSVLSVLDGLTGGTAGTVTVLLTNLAESELGDAVLARLHRGKLLEADRYTLLGDLLGTRGLDPRIRGESWLVDALIGLASCGQLPRTTGGALGRTRAASLVVKARLGVDPEHADLPDLVEALDDPARRSRWTDLSETERGGLTSHLSDVLGPAAGVVAALAAARPDLIAELLVAQAITAAPTDDTRAAAGLGAFTQSRFDPPRPGRADLAAAGAAAVVLARTGSGARIAQQVHRADGLLDELDAAPLAVHSPVLPRGFEDRLADAANRLDEVSLRRVADHREAHRQAHRVRRVRSVARLHRWLATAPEPRADTAAAAAAEHARELACVDRCLIDIRAGDADARVATVLADTASRAGAARTAFDLAFAARLALARDTPTSSLAVENLLPALVAPLADAGVLLIVIDGMSGAVAGDLAEALTGGSGWSEIVRSAGGGREAVLAALPSETRYSRASLFRAALAPGQQADERAAFAAHPFWPAAGVLVHKAGVGGRNGGDLGPELENALAPGAGHSTVVAVVLNAVDDSLAKGRQSISPAWSPGDVAGLPQLLDRAATAGRVVVLTSDHGHMLEHGSTVRGHAGGGARWRPPGAPVEAAEVLVSGPRVLTETGTAVLAATEDVRFGARAHGYHGGATLAEVAIPLIVLLPPGVAQPAGWYPAAGPPPWWSGTAVTDPVPAALPRRTAAKKAAAGAGEGLFELPPPEPAPQRAGRGATLVASSAFRNAHAEMPANRVPAPEVFEAVVDALVAAGGRLPIAAVASAAGSAGRNPRGLVAALKRVLNRDSYAVLDLVDGGRAVALDTVLLDEQFPKRA